ncbi:MAG TPA: site-specific integrase [Planctomycetota bacterium]|nr:site-specific integrase [Planctomycetota bacterium]
MPRSRKKTGDDAPVVMYVEGRPLTLHKATGQGYVRLPNPKGGTTRHYVGTLYKDPKRTMLDRTAVERAQRLIRESQVLGGARPEDPTVLTVGEIVARHAAHAVEEYGNGSREPEAFRFATKALLELYGDTPAKDFGPLALRAVRTKLLEARVGADGGPVVPARKTINDKVARIVRVFKWAASHELVGAPVYQALATVGGLRKGRSAAREGERRRPIPRADLERTLPHLARIVRAMVEVQLLTAARPTEICTMRPCDIDRSGEIWTYRPARHKGTWRDQDREIAIGPKAQAVLIPFLLRDGHAYCFSPKEAEAERRAALHEERVTPPTCGNTPGSNRRADPRKTPGDRYTATSYRHAVERACKDAKVDRWTPARLRHTAASELRAAYGLEIARLVCGHTSAGVTAAHYAEADRQQLLRVAKELG